MGRAVAAITVAVIALFVCAMWITGEVMTGGTSP